MPPGGFRLAIINTTSLKIGRATRDELRGLFRSEPEGPAPKDSVDVVGLAHRPLQGLDGKARLLGGIQDNRFTARD